MKNMRVFKRQVGGYMSALEKSRPELYKTIKAYRDRQDKPGEQKTFDELEKRYGVAIAGLALFLKKGFDKSEVEAIVQNIEQEDSTNV